MTARQTWIRRAVLAAGLIMAAPAAEAQIFLRCQGAPPSGAAVQTPFDRVFAIAEDGLYSLEADGRLLNFCNAETWDQDPRLTSLGPIDGVSCMVDPLFVRVLTTPSPVGPAGDDFVQIEIERATNRIRVMVGHPSEGAGHCRPIDDPRGRPGAAG